MKNIFNKIMNFPNNLYNMIILKYRYVKYGKNLKVNGRIFCVSNNKCGIQIGDNVRINSCLKANPIGEDVRTVLFAKGNAKIYIGDCCGISNATIYAEESITLGKYVLIGGGTHIYDTDFHSIDFKERMNNHTGKTKAVIIKDGAFIGARCIILKGVVIGEKSIVGAGSVVTKSIPDGELWAGNPARFIRKV